MMLQPATTTNTTSTTTSNNTYQSSLEFVLDRIPQMVWQSNKAGSQTLFTNMVWRTYTGLESDRTHEQWRELVHPEDAPHALQAWERCVNAGESASIVYRIRRACDGEYRWHKVCNHYFESNDSIWWVGSATSDHPLTDPALARLGEGAEEVYYRAVEAAINPIITIDATDGTILTYNRAAQNVFQYSKEEILGKPFTTLMDDSISLLHDMYAAHQPHDTMAGRSIHTAAKKKNGLYIPVSLSVGDFTNRGQQMYVVILHEPEEEMKLQQELHKSKDSFLRTMSHELRTPLFGLLGTMSMMQAPTNSDAEVELKQMEECTRRLLSVVNNMIDFYKLENLFITPLPLPFQPRELVAEVCNNYQSCVAQGVTFAHVVRENVPHTLVADSNFIKHTLSNIICNALRFTHTGSVIITVGIDEPTTEDNVMLNFVITDSGIGIASDFFPKMFQPFTQEDSSDSRQYGGVGLGLAVSKHLVDLLGGTISFKSTLGQGTEFKVAIPTSLQKTEQPPFLHESPPPLPANPLINLLSPAPSPGYTSPLPSDSPPNILARTIRRSMPFSPLSLSALISAHSRTPSPFHLESSHPFQQRKEDGVDGRTEGEAGFIPSARVPSPRLSPASPRSPPSPAMSTPPAPSSPALVRTPPTSPPAGVSNLRAHSPVSQVQPDRPCHSPTNTPSTCVPPLHLAGVTSAMQNMQLASPPSPRATFVSPTQQLPASPPQHATYTSAQQAAASSAQYASYASPAQYAAYASPAQYESPRLSLASPRRSELTSPRSELGSRTELHSPRSELGSPRSELATSPRSELLSFQSAFVPPSPRQSNSPTASPQKSSHAPTKSKSMESIPFAHSIASFATATSSSGDASLSLSPPLIRTTTPSPPPPAAARRESLTRSYSSHSPASAHSPALSSHSASSPYSSPHPHSPLFSSPEKPSPLMRSTSTPSQEKPLPPSLVSSHSTPNMPSTATPLRKSSFPSFSLARKFSFSSPLHRASSLSALPSSLLNSPTPASPRPQASSPLSFAQAVPPSPSQGTPRSPTRPSHPLSTPTTPPMIKLPPSPMASPNPPPSTATSLIPPSSMVIFSSPPISFSLPAPLHSALTSLGSLLTPSPASSLPSPDTTQPLPTPPSPRLTGSHSPLKTSGPIEITKQRNSPSYSSPLNSPHQQRARENPPEISYLPIPPPWPTSTSPNSTFSSSPSSLISSSPSDMSSSPSPVSSLASSPFNMAFSPPIIPFSPSSFSSIPSSPSSPSPLILASSSNIPSSPSISYIATMNPPSSTFVSFSAASSPSYATISSNSPTICGPSPCLSSSPSSSSSSPSSLSSSPAYIPSSSSSSSSPNPSDSIPSTPSPSTSTPSSSNPSPYSSTPSSTSSSSNPSPYPSTPSSASSSASSSACPTPSPNSFSSSSSSSSSPTSLPLSAQNAGQNNAPYLGLKVLVVEDNAVNQNVIKRMLEKAKCDVVLASNGKEALDILYDESCEKYVGYHNFNLILMDCQMPVIDGYQATLSIREWETSQYGTPHMRVIALTASSCAENEKQCYLAGMDSFIAKPVTYQALTSRIASEQICGSPVGEYSL